MLHLIDFQDWSENQQILICHNLNLVTKEQIKSNIESSSVNHVTLLFLHGPMCFYSKAFLCSFLYIPYYVAHYISGGKVSKIMLVKVPTVCTMSTLVTNALTKDGFSHENTHEPLTEVYKVFPTK